jgi:hypothetical protein
MSTALAATLPGPAVPVAGCLLVQVAARESLDVLRLADRPGSGVVFTGAGAIEALHAARRQGFSRPLLADRRRYAGTARARGTAPFAPSWLTGQRAAGVSAVLTDSGYIGDGDLDALRAVLRQAADAGPDVTAVLPLHPHWLRKDRRILIEEVTGHGVPIAVVLEHRGDPLALPAAAAGMKDLLRAVPSVAMLGAGVGAVAALAFGARWAAVGVRPSLRLLQPVATEEQAAARKNRWRPAPAEIIAAPVLSFAPVAEVVRAYRASPGNRAWACGCPSCHGRTPQWLESASVFDANAHTFGVLLGEADRLRGHDSAAARQRAWRERCDEALSRYGELGLAALGWEPPRLASAWATNTAATGGTGTSTGTSTAAAGVAAGAVEHAGLRSAG